MATISVKTESLLEEPNQPWKNNSFSGINNRARSVSFVFIEGIPRVGVPLRIVGLRLGCATNSILVIFRRDYSRASLFRVEGRVRTQHFIVLSTHVRRLLCLNSVVGGLPPATQRFRVLVRQTSVILSTVPRFAFGEAGTVG